MTEPLTDQQQQEENAAIDAAVEEEERAQAGKEATTREQNRVEWRNRLGQSGWAFVSENEGAKNLFAKTTTLTIGENDFAGPDTKIVCSAASIQFGHRLAKHKILGQPTPSWQFLGAGNKSGAIVLTASGAEGRQALQSIKTMLAVINNNARNFNAIRGSSSIEVLPEHPNRAAVNNIFSLAKIKNINISNITEEGVVRDGVDLYKMTIEFLAQDFPESKWTAQQSVSQETKNAIARRLLLDLDCPKLSDRVIAQPEPTLSEQLKMISKSLAKWLPVVFLGPIVGTAVGKGVSALEEVGDEAASWLADKGGESNLLEGLRRYSSHFDLRGSAHSVYPKASVKKQGTAPSWYVSVLASFAEKVQGIAKKFPLMIISSNLPKQRPNWEEKLTSEAERLDIPAEQLTRLLGGSGLQVADAPGYIIKGFRVPNTMESGDREAAQLYELLHMEMNHAVQEVLRNASDEAGFKKLGLESVYKELKSILLAEFGDCYPDLHLPPLPGGSMQVVPEFYLYDDSMESAALTQITTGTQALQAAIVQHVENQAKSVDKFINGRMMGGLNVSKNAPIVADIRRGYVQALNDELRFSGSTGGFAGMNFAGDTATAVEEALRVIDAVGYLNSADRQAADQEELAKFLGDPKKQFMLAHGGKDAADKFLTNVVSSAIYSKYATKKYIDGVNDRDTLLRNLKEFYFMQETGELPAEILRGPNLEYKAVDKANSGQLSADPVIDPFSENMVPEDDLSPANSQTSESAPATKSIENGATTTCDQEVEQEDPWVQDAKTDEEEQGVKETLNKLSKTAGAEELYAKTAKVEQEAKADAFDPERLAWKEAQKQKETAAEALKKHLAELHEQFKDVNAPMRRADQLVKETARRVKKDISMRRAYPTFKIFFIDEDADQSVGRFHAFDDFYSYSCVQEIRITRSRKIAADMAVIRLTDTGRKLTRGRFDELEMDEGTLEERGLGWKSETLKENPFNGSILQEGVKVQIRLGYDGDPENLETQFLGRIIEISPSQDGKILEVMCQGFGAELEAATMDDPSSELIYYSPQHALCSAMLQPFVQNFGHWSFNEQYNPAQIRNMYEGASAGESPFEFTFLQDAMREQSFRYMRFKNFRNNPQDDNIFAPPPWLYASAWDRFWNNACSYRPLMQTPWEVFKEHELRHPGYISMALPYGHSPSMTMFFGMRGQNYWSRPASGPEVAMAKYWTNLAQIYGGKNLEAAKTDDVFIAGLNLLKKNNPSFYTAFMRSLAPGAANNMGFYIGGKVFQRYRPFRNYHIFTSDYHILQNEIQSCLGSSFNAVELRYANEEDVIEGDEVEDIQKNIEKVETGGSGIFTLQLNDNLPENLVRTYEDFYPSCVTEWMARRYSQGLLIKGLKESYTGSLTVTGEETIKPFDIIMIHDHVTDMYGPIEVESVTHVFNAETGFVSVITPDLCVDANDWFAKGWMDTTIHVLSLVYLLNMRQRGFNTSRVKKTSVGSKIDSVLNMFAAFSIMHWDQTGSPVCVTPLMHNGRPLLGVATASKFASVFTNIWGKWHQWWEDFNMGLEMGGVSEQFKLFEDRLIDKVYGFFDASIGGTKE